MNKKGVCMENKSFELEFMQNSYINLKSNYTKYLNASNEASVE